MKPFLRSLLLLAVVLVITALLLELGLRALALRSGHAAGLASDPDVGIIGMPHVASGAMVTNAQGFNDREFATAALPPKAVGLLRGSITLWNSTIDPGHPCVMISGNASGCGERA